MVRAGGNVETMCMPSLLRISGRNLSTCKDTTFYHFGQLFGRFEERNAQKARAGGTISGAGRKRATAAASLPTGRAGGRGL